MTADSTDDMPRSTAEELLRGADGNGGAAGDASGRMAFIGVSTGSSSIMRIFPQWARILGLPTSTLEGRDIPLDAPPERYRQEVRAIREDPGHLGALVTTHKMALHDAAADLFDELDEVARACGEISSVSKRDGRLCGHAKDPLTAALALADFLPADAFASTRDALVLGAGGAGLALTWCLAERADRPRRIVVTDADPGRLEHLRQVHQRRGTPSELLTLAAADGATTRRLLEEAPEGSMVVNASGLGKDRPGSPVPDGTRFPRSAWVWEFNYRGTLEFLAQARSQQAERGLHVEDGWRYFLHGWSQVIGEVFDIEITSQILERLGRAAEQERP